MYDNSMYDNMARPSASMIWIRLKGFHPMVTDWPLWLGVNLYYQPPICATLGDLSRS